MESQMFQKVLEHIYVDVPPTEIKNEILNLKDAERDRALALWVCHYGFSEIVPKKLDLEIPRQLEDYRKQKGLGDKMQMRDDFWNREDIQTFINAEKYVENTNASNIEWLRQVISWLDEEKDATFIQMIKGRIAEFDRFFSTHGRVSKEKHFNDETGEVQEMKDMFGGVTV